MKSRWPHKFALHGMEKEVLGNVQISNSANLSKAVLIPPSNLLILLTEAKSPLRSMSLNNRALRAKYQVYLGRGIPELNRG